MSRNLIYIMTSLVMNMREYNATKKITILMKLIGGCIIHSITLKISQPKIL